jgi:hypothetical protein
VKLHYKRKMARERIVVLGHGIATQTGISSILGGFDWTPETTTSLEALAKIGARRDVVAVMVEPAAINLPWKQAVTAIRESIPYACIILCNRFSDDIDYAEASAAGAFLLLRLPLHLGELRQSLGFVWAARNKRLHVIPTDPAERSRLSKSAAAAQDGSRVSEQVA